MEEKQKLRAALYLRVSSKNPEGTEEKDKRQTNKNQKARLEEWLSIQKNIEYHEFFPDEQTGRNTQRPHFQEMMKGVEEGKFNVIVAVRVDRLFRSMKDLANYIQFLKDQHAGMIIIDQGINIDPEWKNPTAQLLLNILGAIAEFEDVLISVRTKDGLERVRNEKRKIGRPPFGFIANPDPDKTGEYIPVPDQIDLAKKVIRLKQSGAGYGEISSRTGLSISMIRRILNRKRLYT